VTVTALVVYAVLGPSRILVLGPDSALAPLIAAALIPLVGATGEVGHRVALAGVLALLVGAICIGAGLARLGTIAELVSLPVRIGFLNGLAVVIVVSRLPQLFGFSVDADGAVDELWAFVEGVSDGMTNAASLVIGISCLVVILGLRVVAPRVPGVLVAVVGATLAVALFDLAAHGVAVLGSIPSGLPAPDVPTGVSLEEVGRLFLPALGIAFVVLTDTTALSRAFAPRGEVVDANGEMVALGTANAAGAFFQGFPVSVSSSRTAVAASSGARTQLAGLVGAALIVALLALGGDLIHDLPMPALAAVVIAAGVFLFDLGTLRHLARVRPSELLLAIAAFLGVILVGVLQGIAIAAGLSLADFVRRAWRPYNVALGRIEHLKGYHDVERHPEAREIPELLIYRFDAPLFFANAEYFKRRLEELISSRRSPLSTVVIAAEPITDIDTTAADVLSDLLAELDDRGIALVFAELKGPVKDRLRTYGLYERLGDARFLPTLGTAIDEHVERTGVEWVDWDDLPDGDAT
jgi:high affinity sulfate transporter 1